MVVSWKRVSAGIYDSDDGRFNLYRIEGVNPPAWNVEWSVEEVERRIEADPEHVGYGSFDLIVDGAASKRDAIAIFNEWEES